ncbi:MAG: hypothetical protein IJW92_04755 [Clostridia bacterium]|nr:hypothetical protein [Clostridia bacterium]
MSTLFLIFPAQSACSVTTNCPSLCSLLALKYGSYVTEHPADVGVAITAFKGENGYTVSTPHGEQQTDTPLSVIDRYLFGIADYAPTIFALHGAAVEWRGGAYLFLASTTGGKTTLASYLTSRGCAYLTDDCILLERETLLVQPYTAPIQLRDGGMEVLQKYSAVPDGVQILQEGNFLRRFVYTPAHCAKQAVPLKKIFFIQRNECENCLLPMNTNERMMSLMQAPITNYTVTGDYLRFLSRLAKADCQILRYCDMDFVKELIQNG